MVVALAKVVAGSALPLAKGRMQAQDATMAADATALSLRFGFKEETTGGGPAEAENDGLQPLLRSGCHGEAPVVVAGEEEEEEADM